MAINCWLSIWEARSKKAIAASTESRTSRSLADDALWNGIGHSQIWMSHFDTVALAPPGFHVTASTEVSGVAAMSDPNRKLFGIQFHPEVVHTHAGTRILENFVFDICGASEGLGCFASSAR